MRLIIDHDGAIDDFAALSLLLCSPAVEVKAITVCPADCYREPALLATKRFADCLGAEGILIAAGDFPGVNPFPDRWRSDSYRLAELPALAGRAANPANRVVDEPAPALLARLLSSGERYTLIMTGPLTHLAQALAIHPAIARNIERLCAMAGALRVAGNVARPGHDGSAEWNLYNNPPAAEAVFRSGIEIFMVPLDATNHAALTNEFLARLAAQKDFPASRLLLQAMSLAAPYIHEGGYYFWDTLTAAALLRPQLVTTEKMSVRVVTQGPSAGRTVEDPQGAPVTVAVGADRAAVEELFLRTFAR